MATSQVRVTRVIDGDTFEIHTGDKVRIVGIDAPELREPGGLEAKALLELLILRRLATLLVRGRDFFGRILAEVFVNGRNVGEEMRASGLG